MNTQTDFEEWAKLLLIRKVPESFNHLINSEVIHSGADILKQGGAFEVHLVPPSGIPTTTIQGESDSEQIFVTPILPWEGANLHQRFQG